MYLFQIFFLCTSFYFPVIDAVVMDTSTPTRYELDGQHEPSGQSVSANGERLASPVTEGDATQGRIQSAEKEHLDSLSAADSKPHIQSMAAEDARYERPEKEVIAEDIGSTIKVLNNNRLYDSLTPRLSTMNTIIPVTLFKMAPFFAVIFFMISIYIVKRVYLKAYFSVMQFL